MVSRPGVLLCRDDGQPRREREHLFFLLVVGGRPKSVSAMLLLAGSRADPRQATAGP